jgi:uncharacterized protein (DUF1015 family)
VSNPRSFLRIIRAEVDFPVDTDASADSVYEQAATNLRKFTDEGVLIKEETPCLYIYRQEMKGHVQRGIVSCCSVQDYEQGTILKHEKTRPDKVADRARLTQAINANPGPVFMAYRDDPGVDRLVAEIEQTSPLFDFTASDGVQHTGWRISEPAALEDVFQAVPRVYIADGHHRSEAAARIATERRERAGQNDEDAVYNWFLSVLFPASQLRILPYNRLVLSLGRLGEEEFLVAVRQRCEVEQGRGPMPDRPRVVGMYLGGKWYHLQLQASSREDAVAGLDVSLLQDRILDSILGIKDPTRDPRLTFVGGTRGTDVLEKQVDSGAAAAAFTLYPVSMDQVMDVADAGLFMPPKSTWFAPKLRSGLFVQEL